MVNFLATCLVCLRHRQTHTNKTNGDRHTDRETDGLRQTDRRTEKRDTEKYMERPFTKLIIVTDRQPN